MPKGRDARAGGIGVLNPVGGDLAGITGSEGVARRGTGTEAARRQVPTFLG